MNGVFKFKENLFLRYKKEIALTVGAVVIMASVVRIVPGDATNEASKQLASEPTTPGVEAVIPANGFNVLQDGVAIAAIANYDEGQDAVHRAIELAIEELGYNPDVEPTLTLEENYTADMTFTSVEDLASILKDNLISNLDEVKVKAYVMKIGDDFTVAVRNEEDIKDVLKNAQNHYINSTDMVLDIQLASNEYNSMVMKPEVVMIKEGDLASTRTFTAEADETPVIGEADNLEGMGGPSEEDLLAVNAASEAATAANEAQDAEAVEVVEETPKDPTKDGDTVAVSFAEQVLIVEAYVSESDIKNVEEATDMITKENDEPKVYEVASGDVPSIIAENNDMGLTELYSLNPGLEENATKIHIGDELIVMVPEPELSVATQEELVYTQPIARGVTYVDNPDKYVGSKTTTDAGYDGVMELTAMVSKINGNEVSREIIGEKVLKEAKDKVVSRGSKALPVKGATGKYITPVTDYRITSPFGPRWGGYHYGVDMAVPTGTSVRASDGGTVTIAGWYGTYGYLVEIDHGDGVKTRYGHNSKLNVVVGQEVSQYEEVAKSGSTGRSTGPHVHFEIRFDGVCVNPMDYLN